MWFLAQKNGNSMWNSDLHDWIYQNSRGLSGGLTCSWDKNLYTCVGFAQDWNWIWLALRCQVKGIIIKIVNIYSPVNQHGQRELLEVRDYILTCCGGEAVCLVDDFNVVVNC